MPRAVTISNSAAPAAASVRASILLNGLDGGGTYNDVLHWSNRGVVMVDLSPVCGYVLVREEKNWSVVQSQYVLPRWRYFPTITKEVKYVFSEHFPDHQEHFSYYVN